MEFFVVITHTSCTFWRCFKTCCLFIVGMWEASFSVLWDCHTFSPRCLDVQTNWGLRTKAGLWAGRGGVRWIKEQCGKGGIPRWSSWDQHQEEGCQIYGIQGSPGKHDRIDALTWSTEFYFHTHLLGKCRVWWRANTITLLAFTEKTSYGASHVLTGIFKHV